MKKNILKNFYISSTLALIMIFSVVYFADFTTSEKSNNIKNLKENKLPKVERKKARGEYFFQILRDPATNSIPKNIREKELQFAKSMKTQQLNKTAAVSFDWVEAGPVDVGGRTRALAVDRRNANIVIVGGVDGGVWKSTDKGTTWKMKSDPSSNLSVTFVTQDYANPDVWYYSSGEFSQSARDQSGTAQIFGGGLYKSTNNGDSWFEIQSAENPVQADTPFDFVSKILVSKATGSIFISSNLYGIYRSTDGGNNFTKVFGAAPFAIEHYEMDIADNGEILVTASDNSQDQNDPVQSGLYILTNDGENSENITPEGYNDFAAVARAVVAFAPSNSNVAYLWTDGADDNSNITKFFKINVSDGSSDDRSANLPDFGGDVGSVDTQGSYNMILGVKPDNENFVIFGATNLFRSFDGFATPANSELKNWIGGYAITNDISQYENQHPDQHSLFFEPGNPSAVWSGHDGGLSYTTDINVQNSGINWINKNRGYNVTQFYKISLTESNGIISIGGGAQDNGSPVFDFINNAATNSTDLSSGDGAYIYLAQDFVVSSSQEASLIRIVKSTNEFNYIKPINATEVEFIHPFAVDPINDDILYFPEGNKLWRNNAISAINNNENQNGTDQGWNLIGNVDQSSEHKITSLSVSNNPSHILYLGLSSTDSSPKIVKFANSNSATSGFVSLPITGATNGSFVHDIAINPQDANEIIAVISNYNVISLFHSTNGGQSFTALDGNLEGNSNNPGPSIRSAEIISTGNTKIYVVATSIGVFSTTALNGNNTVWFKEAENLIGNTVSNDIAISSANTIAIGTHGRGIFLGKPNSSVNVDENPITANEFSLNNNYPNPFNPSTKISFVIPDNLANQVAKLTVYDALGKEISTLMNKPISGGLHEVNFNAEGLASGIYIYKLSVGNLVQSKKMILAK